MSVKNSDLAPSEAVRRPLTVQRIREALPGDKDYKLSDGSGLHLQVARNGRKTWIYRFKLGGRESMCVLGTYGEKGQGMSLADARKARMEARELVKQGVNPAHRRKQLREAALRADEARNMEQRSSFEIVGREWLELRQGQWSPKHAEAIRQRLEKDVFPKLGNVPVKDIAPPDLVALLRAVERRDALTTAAKILQHVHGICRHAVATGRTAFNPAFGLDSVLKSRRTEHHRSLGKEQLPEFLRRLQETPAHPAVKLALRFLMLTAARKCEALTAEWSEIDLDAALWRIPGSKTKNQQPHVVPLSSQALAVLEQAASRFGKGRQIFPGRSDGPLGTRTLLSFLERMGYAGLCTVHGFRSTFSTMANESGLFAWDVVERCLAHEERNRVRASYNHAAYLEQRRELMQWHGDVIEQAELELSRSSGSSKDGSAMEQPEFDLALRAASSETLRNPGDGSASAPLAVK